MKLMGYIFSFYLLILAVVPCCAFDDCPADKTEQTTQHENGDDDCGNCSPFFNCETCATATTNETGASFDFLVSISSIAYVDYLQAILPSAKYDFWQPPKIS